MKIISTTKIIFGNKVVRLIFFLLVIGGILTGVAFGIIALIRSLKDPCTTDPTRPIYDPDSKACVPNCGKKKMCNNPKADLYQKCPPDNHCPGSYIYDKNSCECTMKCNSGFKPFTQNGLSSTTEMTKDANGNYTPVNPLICGIPCPLRTNKSWRKTLDGGPDYCNRGYLCAESIDTNERHTRRGECLDSSTFSMCEDHSDIACSTGSKCISKGDVERCEAIPCGNDNGSKPESDKKFFACSANEDCDNNGICKRKTSFHEVGYCSSTNEPRGSDRCVKKSQIGENNYNEIIICDSGVEGISLTYPQCYDALIPGTPLPGTPNRGHEDYACAQKGICSSNNWEAINNSGICKSSSPERCPSSTECYASSSECCPHPAHVPGSPTEMYCCGRKTSHDKLCTNNTLYPYSKLMLLGSGTVPNPNTLDEYINETDPIPSGSSDIQAKLAYYNRKLIAVLNPS